SFGSGYQRYKVNAPVRLLNPDEPNRSILPVDTAQYTIHDPLFPVRTGYARRLCLDGIRQVPDRPLQKGPSVARKPAADEKAALVVASSRRKQVITQLLRRNHGILRNLHA